MTGPHVVLLPLGPDLYAMPISCVREVVAAPAPTRLVTAPPQVFGLFNLRGQIVPLLDTAALLGLQCAEPAKFALVLQSRHGLVGLVATAFPQPALLGSSLGPSELSGTAGTYQWQRQVAVLLDPEVLLVSERLGRSDHLENAAPGGIGR